MFILKYRSLESQLSIGLGIVSRTCDDLLITGTTAAFGMDTSYSSPEIQNKETHIKLFGLEDLWGTAYEWLDGLKTDSNNIYAAKADGFFEQIGELSGAYNNGYIDGVHATSKGGFIPSSLKGSNIYHFADWGVVNHNSHCIAGGNNTAVRGAGLFCIRLGEAPEEANKTYNKTARIMYI